ncbi:iron-dicitrate transporter subunit FecD, partial [Enterobacter mori]
MSRRLMFRYSIVIILLILSSIATLSVGAVFINPIEAIKSVYSQDNFILNEYRLPRMWL